MSILLEAGRLVSTSDEKLARKLQQLVKLDDITHGEKPGAVETTESGTIGFMFAGNYYELAEVRA